MTLRSQLALSKGVLHGVFALAAGASLLMFWQLPDVQAAEELVFENTESQDTQSSSLPSSLSSSRDLELVGRGVERMSAGRDVTLSGATVHQAITAGRDIQGSIQKTGGKLSAGRDVLLNGPGALNSVSAGRRVSLSNLSVSGNVTAGQGLSLVSTRVLGNLAAGGGPVKLQDTTLDGELAVPGDVSVQLAQSSVGSIHVSAPGASGGSSGAQVQLSGRGNVVINTGRIENSAVGNHSRVHNQTSVSVNGNRATIHVGGNSVSQVNGYTVTASEKTDQTTVITPSGSIYVNQRKVSGDDPETYAEYQNQTFDAPSIAGPGWEASNASPKDASKRKKTLKSTPQEGFTPVITLDRAYVMGNIVFEGPIRGQVRVTEGSQIQGKIENGYLIKIPSPSL